jgi:hypothetical protein
MEISTVKTKIMAAQGEDPIHSRICIYNTVNAQVNFFKHFGYYITNKNEKDISDKIPYCNRSTEILNQVFKINLL